MLSVVRKTLCNLGHSEQNKTKTCDAWCWFGADSVSLVGFLGSWFVVVWFLGWLVGWLVGCLFVWLCLIKLETNIIKQSN